MDLRDVVGGFEHVGHGDALEKPYHLPLGLVPDALHLAAVENRAVVVMAFDALVEPERPLDELDDLEERDLAGSPSESVASVSPLLRLHDAAIREKRQNLGQKRLWNPFRLGDLAHAAVAVG